MVSEKKHQKTYPRKKERLHQKLKLEFCKSMIIV